MFLLILLCAIFLQSHAANDDPLAETYQRLQEAEQKSLGDVEGKFIYTVEFKGSVVDDSLPPYGKRQSTIPAPDLMFSLPCWG